MDKEVQYLKQGNRVIAEEYEKVGQELKNKLTEAEKEVSFLDLNFVLFHRNVFELSRSLESYTKKVNINVPWIQFLNL